LYEHVLVTVSAGFIGSYLVDALVKWGHRVRALRRCLGRVFDSLEPQVHGGLREQGKWPNYCNPESIASRP
jgi:nucleoside-diphosphate-sugar epimerase